MRNMVYRKLFSQTTNKYKKHYDFDINDTYIYFYVTGSSMKNFKWFAKLIIIMAILAGIYFIGLRAAALIG